MHSQMIDIETLLRVYTTNLYRLSSERTLAVNFRCLFNLYLLKGNRM